MCVEPFLNVLTFLIVAGYHFLSPGQIAETRSPGAKLVVDGLSGVDGLAGVDVFLDGV